MIETLAHHYKNLRLHSQNSINILRLWTDEVDLFVALRQPQLIFIQSLYLMWSGLLSEGLVIVLRALLMHTKQIKLTKLSRG